MKKYSIVYSNYTGQVFAWLGSKKDQKKYLGNRDVIGEVLAADEESALEAWRKNQTDLTSH